MGARWGVELDDDIAEGGFQLCAWAAGLRLLRSGLGLLLLDHSLDLFLELISLFVLFFVLGLIGQEGGRGREYGD